MFRLIALLIIALIAPLCASSQGDSALNDAKSLYQEGRFSDVIAAVDEIVNTEEENFEALLLKGDSYQKLEKFVAAIQCYEQAKKIDKNSALLYANWGSAYFNLNQLEEAETRLKKSLKLDPELADAYYFMGNVEYMKFKTNSALKYYNKAIELRNDYRDAIYMRAAANAELENYWEAIRDYEQVLELDPNLESAKYNIAVIHLVNEQYDTANELLAEINPKLLPKAADFYFYQAEALYFSGNEEEACPLYKTAADYGDKESLEIYERYCLNKEEREALKEKRTIRMAF